ncbi:hypothetical protein EG329_009634 [Mollisiaceae sp. DMI_Dod_QoI]|nr:hypothetical protein EG329_009634 [Helotiales sp. DMI_Dod_QoI]
MAPDPGNHTEDLGQSNQLGFTTRDGNHPTTPKIAAQSSNEPSGLFPWQAAVELGVPGQEAGQLDPPKPQSSAASHSSIVNDLGNAKYLADSRTAIHTGFSTVSRASTDELVAYLGAGLPESTNLPVLREVDITGHGEVTPQDNVHGQSLGDQPTEGENLGESIRAALEVSQFREGKKFLPNNSLEEIITRERVRKELSHLKVVQCDGLDSLTDEILKVTSPSSSKSSGKETTRMRIFAILGLMEKIEEIVYFVKGDLHDCDLPFILREGLRPGTLRLCRKCKGGKLSSIPLFVPDKWRTHDLELFDTYQWQLLAPYFQLSTDTNRKVLHYNLEENSIILPFIEDDEITRGHRRAEGGYGEVWRVKIHPAHHNCCSDSASSHQNPSFAVKRLLHGSYKAFHSEVSSLKRFSEKDHVHLIKLLVTFSWRGQFYLLFPWADGNLLDFWKLYPQPSNPKRDDHLALWFSEQCRGLVQGLKMIHTADVPSMDHLPDVPKNQIHGRHGDLKPENILWFKSYEEHTDERFSGVLKISDFGLMRFHSTQSVSNFETVPVSGTYRPPEYDVANKVSQSYDIWALGCVLLQFATWYLLGWEEVDKFSQARMQDNSWEVAEDAFFNFVSIKDSNGTSQTGARAKVSVAKEFQKLYDQENCSDFVIDLLTFIHDRLLRIHPKNRANCEEILEKFTELHESCRNDRKYGTRRLKKPPKRTATALSELSASTLELSSAKNNEIRKDPLPEHTGPVEDGCQSPAPDSQSPAMELGDIIPMDSVASEGIQYESKGKGRLGTASKNNPLSEPIIIASTSSYHSSEGTQRSRPQSPMQRAVHFDEKQKRGQDLRKSEDDPRLNSEPSSLDQEHAIEHNRNSFSRMGIYSSRIVNFPSSSPAPDSRAIRTIHSMDSIELSNAPGRPNSNVNTDESGEDVAPLSSTSANTFRTIPLQLDGLKTSNLRVHEEAEIDSQEVDDQPQDDREGSRGGFPVNAVPSLNKPRQAQTQNNQETQDAVVKENGHLTDQNSGSIVASRNRWRSVKHFFSRLGCFACNY